MQKQENRIKIILGKQVERYIGNTKNILRCDKFPDRVGKSRLELLTGRKHPNWLQLLEY
jgi:hypothetical protein